ncbi:MAG: hypothetical protein AAF228_14075 [Pseudomonadota bacterium]
MIEPLTLLNSQTFTTVTPSIAKNKALKLLTLKPSQKKPKNAAITNATNKVVMCIASG